MWSRSLKTTLAKAAQDHVVVGDLEADLVGELGDRALQGGVLEGDHATAAAADRVVVVLAAGLDALVAGGAAGHLEALHEAELLELLERPVDAGAADRGLAAAQLVVELEGGDGAVVAGERLDHGGAGAAAPVAGLAEGGEGVLGPGAVGFGLGRHQAIVAFADGSIRRRVARR